MEVKEESEKVGLKLNIQKTKIMASSPITSWQIDGETIDTVTEYFGGSKITADGDCSHEIKRRLLLGMKVMTNLDSIHQSDNRDLYKLNISKYMCMVNEVIFSSTRDLKYLLSIFYWHTALVTSSFTECHADTA